MSDIEENEIKKKFLSLSNPWELSALLGIDYASFTYWLYRAPEGRKYEVFQVPKKSGEFRVIRSPKNSLRFIQYQLCKILTETYQPNNTAAHGFITGKSIVTNADYHVGKKFVLNIDLQDFFPSINFGRIRGLFMAWPYKLPAGVATVLAQVVTHNNELPQGAPTSPILSNMICARMDSDLTRLARKFHCHYTRYADDITFSTNRSAFPKQLALVDEAGQLLIGDALSEVIKKNGFSINPEKNRLQRKDMRQKVTGLVVNKKVNLRREYIRQLRAMLHAWKKYGLISAQNEYNSKYSQKGIDFNFDSVVRGKIAHLKMVRGETDEVYRKFAQNYNELTSEKKIILPLTDKEYITKASWVIESAKKKSQGTGFLLEGIGIVTCEHVLEKDSYIFHTSDVTKKYVIVSVKSEKAIDLSILQVEGIPQFPLVPSNKDPQDEQKIRITGFPNYQLGDSLRINEAKISGFRSQSGIRRALIANANIISGMSGGAVLDNENKVVGIAVRGARGHDEASDTEKHEIIPISALKHLA